MEEKTLRHFNPDTYIYLEGDEDSDRVYIIEEGRVELHSSEGRIPKRKPVLGQGDVFGFVASLSRRPRIETARALTAVRCVSLQRERFLSLLQKNSDIAVKMINFFADELRVYDDMMFSVGDRDQVSEDEEMFRLGEHYYKRKEYNTAYYILNRYLEMYPGGEFVKDSRELVSALEVMGVRSITEPIVEGKHKTYTRGQIIFCEGEPGDELYIIREGKVKIVKRNNDAELILSVLKEGDIFGELAIVSEKFRNATAICFEKTKLLPIDRDSLMVLIGHSPEILKRIFMAISQRVWFTYMRLESRLYRKPITRIYALLENKLLEDRVSREETAKHTFHFGIDDLIKMTEVDVEYNRDVMDTVLMDQNLSFNFGQILVENPSQVIHTSRYYKKRDRL
jgi:CRP-like cAMP-binding protein